ncbi:MAG: prepilin-type N-terminal cleavage/methylation domain-containing protein [Nitrospirae bacterium]|nr:prepilin-type N-terminal cleavage/methylation domain-containing protein [Nitrospirota bacterium]
MGKIKKRAGFTLIEVTIAIFILIVIIGSVLMLLSSSYASLKGSEAKNIAKNIGTYTVEYIRSRNVTRDNTLDHDIATEFGDDASHYYPGLVDLWDSTTHDSPLQSDGWPYEDTGTLETINVHPALPDEKYGTNSNSYLSFYFSLQGYVSLGDFDHLTSADPSPEDANAYICSSNTEHYHDRLYEVAPATENGHTMDGNHYLIRFPFDSTSSDAIKNFSAGPTYIPMIYTTDPNKINSAKPEYDPHYTNIASDKSKTMDYNGFRVLTSIAARAKEDESNPGHPLPHVQYYDVKVTVLWVTGGDEHEYSLATQIVTY